MITVEQVAALNTLRAAWDLRDAHNPEPGVRLTADYLVAAIDAMCHDLYQLRSLIVSQRREYDDLVAGQGACLGDGRCTNPHCPKHGLPVATGAPN